MAERRMFSKKIIDSDLFLDMPLSTQALYFHLSMRADDEGFINNPKKIQRMIGASDDDFKLLNAKQLVLVFESGVVVVKHWKIHNYIRKERITETMHSEEKSMICESENNIYNFKKKERYIDGHLSDTCQTDDGHLSDTCPHRLGKVRLGKVRLGKVSNIYSVAKDDTTDPQTNEVIEYLNTKTGKALRGSKADKKHINARFAEGYKLEDFQKVVDIKVAEWENDAEMSKYLRISTLFGTKFDTYLNQKPPKNGGQFAEEGMYDNLGW